MFLSQSQSNTMNVIQELRNNRQHKIHYSLLVRKIHNHTVNHLAFSGLKEQRVTKNLVSIFIY